MQLVVVIEMQAAQGTQKREIATSRFFGGCKINKLKAYRLLSKWSLQDHLESAFANHRCQHQGRRRQAESKDYLHPESKPRQWN